MHRLSLETVEFDEIMFYDCNSDAQADESFNDDMRNMLAVWAIKYSISLSSLSALLEILRPHFSELPKDPRTLLKTPRSDIGVELVSNGAYYHFGIANQIQSQLLVNGFEVIDNGSVSVQINVDGVPLFKSTGGQFWPILGKIGSPIVSEPFVIGIFYGVRKPSNLDFLTDFVQECCNLMEHGVVCNDFALKFEISALICDAPARAFLKNIKGHTAYASCERCSQSGAWNGKMTFPETDARKRTDVSFDEMQDPEHHHGHSPLSDLGIGMVSQFVLDYMHLVCLGVVRRLIWLWLSGPVAVNCRLGARCVTSISDRLVSLTSFMPCEFARKPRSLSEWQRWKATEFRQFLLYTGPVALLGKLSDVAYKNFMLLSVGIFILLDKTSSVADIDYAQNLLILFVKHFSDLYGADMVVYNVHNIIHLADDARKYGALDTISAFCFENFLGKLTKLVRKPNKPLEQVVHRLLEREYTDVRKAADDTSLSTNPSPTNEHHSDCLPSSFGICKQYRKVILNGVCISIGTGNSCINIGDDIAVVHNIVVKNGETLIIYQKFQDKQDFFTYPWPSSRFRIYEVSNLGSELFAGKLADFQTKYVMLPHNDAYVVTPLLHV
jgi:hypothetical protein